MEIEIALMAAILSMTVSLTALISSASKFIAQKKTRDVFARVVEEAVSKDPDVNHALRHSNISSDKMGTRFNKDDMDAVKRVIEVAIKEMDRAERHLVREKLQEMNEVSFSRYMRTLSYKLSGNRSVIGLLVRRIFKGSILSGNR
ncbi:hypothetical protein [Sphingopyxis sp. R3-92]|uniref:hypothetical protein n=1 Tax=Sphingopyxis sp. R3-92 TaxID=3158553 RepID=UPI003EE6DEF6